MKIATRIIQIILIVLLSVNLFIWLAARASGHNIPIATNIAFGLSALLLLILILIVSRSIKIKKQIVL
jgi:hypothetical protein